MTTKPAIAHLPVLNVYPLLKRCGIWVCPLCRQDCKSQIHALWRQPEVVTGSSFNHDGLSDNPVNRLVTPDIFPTWFVFWTCSTCRHGHGHYLASLNDEPEITGEL